MQPIKIVTISGMALALLGLVNGVVMLTLPSLWYEVTPGVPFTGPLNVHFVRDIGFAYIAASLALWFGIGRKDALLVFLAAVFHAGHAATHVIDHATGCGAQGVAAIAGEVVGIYAPAATSLILTFVWMKRPEGA